ncbi:hypothetical protein HU200_023463 [Digitaria exilis]|uniref:Uncharacterized protein n=1 Tax=Digitaria exilis TaxID=1010633 RepID=A0A835C4V7_9POAL|nr:hypothetical protein HU200_023463 [Digitaria exilis]
MDCGRERKGENGPVAEKERGGDRASYKRGHIVEDGA